MNIPNPKVKEVEKYLDLWDSIEKYTLQENSLRKLFLKTYSLNKNIDDVLIKVCSLNDLYKAHIFSTFSVAKHIISLSIDNRLKKNDLSLVEDIAAVEIGGKKKNFYSFATKYCSHHKSLEYPIYDRYVEKILKYFLKRDNFSSLKKINLRDYTTFKKILEEFKVYYGLENYNLKDIDRYLWQLGKKYFPIKYYKRKQL